MSVELTALRALAITAAGCGAGFINAIVGSGTLISYPTIVGVGFDRLAANIANNIGLFPGSLSASYGYRRELAGQRRLLMRLIPMSALGGLTGSLLLLVLPSRYFNRVVPFLVLIGVLLVLVQPVVQRAVKFRQARRPVPSEVAATPADGRWVSPWLQLGVLVTGVYGGYFGAAQGIILMGMLGIALSDDLQRLNATKNVLATVVNGTAAVVFVIRGDVSWGVVGLVAFGSVLGAQVGALMGRRIPPAVLRAVIVVVGTVVAVKLFLG